MENNYVYKPFCEDLCYLRNIGFIYLDTFYNKRKYGNIEVKEPSS